MKRLYLQVYLTVVASLLLVVLAAGAMWRLTVEAGPASQAFELAGEVAAAALPAADAPREVQQEALEKLAARLHADLALFDAGRMRIAAAGKRLSPPEEEHAGGWRRNSSWRAGGWIIHLPDGRSLAVRLPRESRHPAWALIAFLGVIALAVALGAYPVVRRITRRLERLQASVEALGSGNLSARVRVTGGDEVARLAASFNRAAARIEELIGAQKLLLESNKRLLAHASHELRTPLARIRMGVELLKRQDEPKRKAELERDIAELDQLIDEILLASRLDAVAEIDKREEVDLLALAAEECARYEDCALDGEPLLVQGDARLLRRMIRNLLENAQRHGIPPIEVSLRRKQDSAELCVCDHGAGVPEAERERLFEPFYRLPGATSGAGLGLSLVRQIAARHGGSVRVRAGAAGGACISVEIAASVGAT
jgi:two-component system, OmpR family, sensor histidine kinase RstB